MPIFAEHLEGNLQFYPNFALFLTLGGINLDHDFVQVSKLSEDPKKVLQNWNTFCPNSGEDQKKRFSPKMELFFPPKFKWTSKLRRTPASNDWGDADVDHTQTNGGDTVKLFEEIYPPHPPPSVFRHSWYQ